MADKMINLGREDSAPCCCSGESKKGEKRIYFPSLYINGVKGLDLDTGELTFTAKGKVVSVSKRDRDGRPESAGEDYSCEIEVHEISIPGAKKATVSEDSGDKLDRAFSEISKKKSTKDEPEEVDDEEEEMDEEE